jgi:hypothetical protein
MTSFLFSLAGFADAECITGDLHEELAVRKVEYGTVGAASWYIWQLLRSLAGPLAWRALLAAVMVMPPAIGLQLLWISVFDWLCVRPQEGMLGVNLACVLAGAMLSVRSLRVLAGGALGAGIVFAIWVGPSAFPYIVAGLLATPVGVGAAQMRKEIIE